MKKKKKQIPFHSSASGCFLHSCRVWLQGSCWPAGRCLFFTELQVSPRHFLGIPWNRKGGKSLETTVVVHLTGLLWHVSFHPTASGVCWEPGEAPSETPNLQWEEATLCFDFVSVQKIVVKEVTPMAISAVLCSKCFQLCWNIFQRIQVLEIRNSIKYRNVFLGVKGHLTLQFNNLLFFLTLSAKQNLL